MRKTAAMILALMLLTAYALAQNITGEGDAPPEQYDGYFDDAVFFGDSVTRQLRNYASAETQKGRPTLGTARFLVAGKLTLYAASRKNLYGDVRLRYRGSDVTVHGGFKAMEAKKAFVLIGLNDHVGSQMEKDVSRYASMIDHILESCPGITLICQSMNPIQEHRQSKTLNKANLDAFNERLKALCAEKGVLYLDIATPLMNEEGFLRPEYALSKNDNVHLNESGCAVWVDTLRRFAREQIENGAQTPETRDTNE